VLESNKKIVWNATVDFCKVEKFTQNYGPPYSPLMEPLKFAKVPDIDINKDYKFPIKRDIAVCLAFFSPTKSNNLFSNYKKVKNKLDKAKIPNYTIELCYNNNENITKNPFVTLNTNSIMFHKENLWNIIAKKVSKRYKKLLFLDSDIIFTNTNWYNDLSKMLNNFNIVQPFELAFWQGQDDKIERSNPCSAQFIGLNNKLDF
jgi:hypothetical protein